MAYPAVYREIQASLADPFKVRTPWVRMRGHEFREHEQAQLDQFHSWVEGLRKGAISQANVYVVPLRLSATVKASLRNRGTPIGLGALYNQDGGQVVAIVPEGKPIPQDGQFIRIESATLGAYFPERGSTIGDYCVTVEAWTEQEPLVAYSDVEVKPKELVQLVTEALGCDPLTGLVHGLPLLSSPPRNMESGGVSVAVDTFGLSASQVDQFQRDHRSLTPPEMRPWPAGNAAKGAWTDLRRGVEMHFAQRPPQTGHTMTHFVAEDPATYAAQAARQRGGEEESRHASMRLANGSTRSKAIATILGHAAADASLPMELDEVIDVKYVQRTIHRFADSRIWGAVAASHLHTVPQVDGKALSQYVTGVADRIEGELESFARRTADRRALMNIMAPRLPATFVQLGSSFARANGVSTLGVPEAKKVHDTQLRLFERFVEKNRAVLVDLGQQVSRPTDPRYRAVQFAVLAEPYITYKALWEQVGRQPAFDGDQAAFEGTLKFMTDKFHVHQDPRGRFLWIGGVTDR